jgi:hypothetical protein
MTPPTSTLTPLPTALAGPPVICAHAAFAGTPSTRSDPNPA